MKILSKYIGIALAAMAVGCGGHNTASTASAGAAEEAPQQSLPTFNADSAYAYVAKQVSFGPRVPGSKASKETAQWLVSKLEELGAHNITQQNGQVTAYNGDKLDITNISASLNPEAQRRVLLIAHWDSRPWADQEADASQRNKPIDGANDGASGVGVILEIARNAALQAPKDGIDILFVDAEDYGRRSDATEISDTDDSWCLGTQYWMQNPTIDLATINYAVLLDMVGGKGAVFNREYFSEATNSMLNDIYWNEAKKAGYTEKFSNKVGNPIIDDHIYLLRAGIPAIDIIESVHADTQSFNPTWHTHADNIDNIDPASLKAVGQTVMNVLYKGL